MSRSISPLNAAVRNLSAEMGCSNPSAIRAPRSAFRMCHISVFPMPHLPSGWTWTERLAEVNRNFTRIGKGGSAVNQASPSFWLAGCPVDENHGARSLTPQTRSWNEGVRRTGESGRDKFVDAVKSALQFL